MVICMYCCDVAVAGEPCDHCGDTGKCPQTITTGCECYENALALQKSANALVTLDELEPICDTCQCAPCMCESTTRFNHYQDLDDLGSVIW